MAGLWGHCHSSVRTGHFHLWQRHCGSIIARSNPGGFASPSVASSPSFSLLKLRIVPRRSARAKDAGSPNFTARREREDAHFIAARGKIGSPEPRFAAQASWTRPDRRRRRPVFEQKEGTMSVSFYLGNLKDDVTTIDFVKDLDINMSNSKARMVLNALGIPDTDDLGGQLDRVQFANLCASWLQQHIGKQSAKIDTSVMRGTFGATFIDCGVPEGYINRQIRRLSEAARAADDGNVIYWG
jgi:hypothetical protein